MSKAKTKKKMDHAVVRAVVEFIFDSHVDDVEMDLSELSAWIGAFVSLDQPSSDKLGGFMGTLISVTPVENM